MESSHLQTAQLVDAEMNTIFCDLVKLWHSIGHHVLTTPQLSNLNKAFSKFAKDEGFSKA